VRGGGLAAGDGGGVAAQRAAAGVVATALVVPQRCSDVTMHAHTVAGMHVSMAVLGLPGTRPWSHASAAAVESCVELHRSAQHSTAQGRSAKQSAATLGPWFCVCTIVLNKDSSTGHSQSGPHVCTKAAWRFFASCKMQAMARLSTESDQK